MKAVCRCGFHAAPTWSVRESRRQFTDGRFGMADDNVLDQSEIERLLSGMGGGEAPPPPSPAAPEPDDGGGLLGQAELDALFAAAGSSPKPEPKPAAPPPAFAQAAAPAVPPRQPAMPKMAFGGRAASGEPGDEEGIPQGDINYLLKRSEEAIDSLAAAKFDLPTEVIEFQYPEFGGTVPNTEHATLDQISEVELDVKIELGRANMFLEDVLKLRRGSVVPLDKMAGDAVDVYVNGRLLARGEVLVMNENFCVRVAELLAGAIPIE